MKHFAVFNFHLITGLLILFVAGTAARGAPCDPLAEAFRKADKQDRMGEQVKKQIIFPIEVNSSRIGNVRCDPDNSNEPCQDAKGPDATSMLAKRYWDIILESEKAGMYKCRLVETESSMDRVPISMNLSMNLGMWS